MNVSNSLSVQTFVVLQHWLTLLHLPLGTRSAHTGGIMVLLQHTGGFLGKAASSQAPVMGSAGQRLENLPRSWADHVCRIDAYFWLPWPGLPLQTAELSEHESPKLPGPCRTSSTACKPRVGDYQHLNWDAMIATLGPVVFEPGSAAEIQEVFQFTRRLWRFLFHVHVRIKLAFEKSEVLCCWQKKVKSWRIAKRVAELLKWPCSWEYQGLENISDGNLPESGNAYRYLSFVCFEKQNLCVEITECLQRLEGSLMDLLELPVLGENPKLRGHKRHRGGHSMLVNSLSMGPW